MACVLKIWLLISFLVMMAFIIPIELKFLNCQFPKLTFNPELEITRYGKPTPFVFTKSTGVSPYTLTDPYRQSAVYHEYLLIGPGLHLHGDHLGDEGSTNTHDDDYLSQGEEEIRLVLYDESAIHTWQYDPNLVEQNLGKEYFWAFINATGMLPSLTLVNTTFEKSLRFHTEEGDTVAYHLSYPNLFRSLETLPPMDVVVEFPAKTRMFQSLKTMIDYQTFGLLRWRLTPSDIVAWDEDDFASLEWAVTIKDLDICNKPPGDLNLLNDIEFLHCIYEKRLKVLENPCIKDMLILYTLRGVKGIDGDHGTFFTVNRLLIVIPMVYELLSYRGFIDLTEAYCPRPSEVDECGEPLDIVLTNDHLLIMTDRGLWVSNSLNISNVNASFPYSMKPLLKFEPVDPCFNLGYFNCTHVGLPILARQVLRRQRLFYTAVCHLFQYPVYEDIVIYVVEHVSQTADLSEERDLLTIMYAPKPYKSWRVLVHAGHEYISEDGPLSFADLLGIFYNHQRRHFDITLLLKDSIRGEGEERVIRFVLPMPTDPNFTGYKELNGLLGNGFLEFEFPPFFELSKITVSTETLDVFFTGNQIWIAEAGGPFVYVTVPFVTDEKDNPSLVSSCSFNHPDRTYICLEKTHQVIYSGRVGTSYDASPTLFSKITELRYTMLYNLWPFSFRQYTAVLGNFVVGYSGKIMLWYIYHPNHLVESQKVLVDKLLTSNLVCDDPRAIQDQPVKCHVCKSLASRVIKYNCQIVEYAPDEASSTFKMLAIDATKLYTRDEVTEGPLIPFIINGDALVLFEGTIPELSKSKPPRDYLTEVDVGEKIICPVPTKSMGQMTGGGVGGGGGKPPPPPPPPPVASKPNVTCPSMVDDRLGMSNCELYVHHMKNLERDGEFAFLQSFRRVLYTTLIKPFPLRPIPVDMVVLVLPNSNEAVIQLDTGMFDPMKEYTFQYGDVGQTLFIPEHFSVFMTGFAKFQECNFPTDPLLHDLTRMTGYATRYYRQGARVQLRPFEAFIIDFSTPEYCSFYVSTLRDLNKSVCTDAPHPSDVISENYRRRRAETNLRRIKEHENRGLLSQSLSAYYRYGFYGVAGQTQPDLFQVLQPLTPSTYEDVEDDLLTVPVPAVGSFSTFKLEINKTYDPNLANPAMHVAQGTTFCGNKHSWQIRDGGCHLRIHLTNNPVLKQSGGRISLDKFDSISFQVKLRPLTAIGRSLIHRPLISVTNTNPDILTIDQSDYTGPDVQIVNITLSPSGVRVGVASVTIRPLIVSNVCLFAEGSFTLIVQIQRAPGRRLHVNYPVPTCKPHVDSGEYERPWKIDLPQCVSREDLLGKHEVKRPEDEDIGQVFYSELPVNYRPPSRRGADIPLSKILYNADPTKPWYNEKYRISKETGDLGKCEGKLTQAACDCSDNDALSDDEVYSDCKRMVYTAKRGFRVDISLEFDRIMRDEDQHGNSFSPKNNWAVYLEEINDRAEFTLSSQTSPYLELINSNPHLHQGRKHYDAKTLGVTLHGTGLFHFKATLGHFESFDVVSGYFIIFIPNDEFNHVKLIVIMLLTITICMVFVFCGFLLVRRQLSSQLPFQAHTSEKIKLE